MEAPTTQREVEEEEVLVDVQIQEQEEGKTPEKKGKATDPWDVLADHMRAVKAALVDIRELNRFEMSEEERSLRVRTLCSNSLSSGHLGCNLVSPKLGRCTAPPSF